MTLYAIWGPIDLLENKLGIDFSINRVTKNINFSSADKLFDGPTLDPMSLHPTTDLTKYYPGDAIPGDDPALDGIDIVFDFGISGSKFESQGATIRGVQLTTAADSPNRDATSWTLEGSNDTATAWTLIDSETVLAPPTDRNKDYDATMFPTSKAFRFFRFKVTSTVFENLNTQLSSLRFFGGPTVTSFHLAYSAGAHGSITGVASQTVNSGESGTAVTAVAASGYHFVKWIDNDSTQNPRIDTNVGADITASALIEADVTSSPVVSSAPVMDPQQDAVITKAVALLGDNGKSNQIVVKGSFPSEIRNVSINGKYLPREDWKQSETQLLITYDVSNENELLVQVWNARVPLLKEIKVELVAPTPSATPTPTPTPSATPTPSPSPTAKTAISVSKKKKVIKTVICYRGKLMKKVRAATPICPKGYKLRKY